MWQIVVEGVYLMAFVWIILVLLRTTDLFFRSRWPAAAAALEYGIGKG